MKKTLFALFALTFLFFVPFQTQAAEGLNLYFFYGDGCPHCAREAVFLDEMMRSYPEINIYAFEIYNNPANVQLFIKIAESLGQNANGVPFLVIGDQPVIGYANGMTSTVIETRIQECLKGSCTDSVATIVRSYGVDVESHVTLEQEEETVKEESAVEEEETEIAQEDIDTSAAASVQDEENDGSLPIYLPFIGYFDASNYSLPVLAVIIGALDGFNPCAMWTLLFLISLLLGMQNKKRMWILGSTFIVASAAVYFVFMAAWLNIILFIGFVFWVRLLIGLLAMGVSGYNFKEFFFNKEAVCKITSGDRRQKVFDKIRSIISEKSFWIALVGIILLAFAVNLVELLCSAGLPVIFTQLLAMNDLSVVQYYLYILLYIFFFMIDDLFVFFTAMITLHVTGITTRYTRASRLIGGVLMLIIGLLLVLKPQWLLFG